jgi:hypothetical protein
MFKKLNFVFFVVISLFSQMIFAEAGSRSAPSSSVVCSPILKRYVNTILKVPEARALIERVQREGAISIAVHNDSLSRKFGAFWDGEDRVIAINMDAHDTEGEIIGSIIFELHNAAAEVQLNHIDELASQGRIDRNRYTESVERIEYENSWKAARVAERGIAMGVFPQSARLRTFNSFEEYYRLQKIGGHSACISRNYDLFAPHG